MEKKKKNIIDLKNSVEYDRLSQTREDKLLNWLDGEKTREHKNTEKKKEQFIQEIKDHLGKDMLINNSFQPKKIKTSFFYKLKVIITRFFNTF